MYEHKGQALLPFRKYIRRQVRSVVIGLGIIAGSLLLGVLGYHFFARLGWIDAILNAAMILTGMGPVDPTRSVAAKLFASFYALFSGVIFLVTVGVMLAPAIHRVLHKFHLQAGKS